ncbi:MAG: Zn-dependent hydrolase [Acidimicrobiales bacterium]|nr:Zn-dependent hydrolase [Acidimicrobiales bacterium]
MVDFHADGKRLWSTLHQLAEIGATEAGGVARVALTDADRAGRDQFVEWVTELGCSVHIDRMGNLFARREGTDPNRDPVVIGSHLDSQPTGGKFDGAYGVMVGLEILRVFADHEYVSKAPIEVVSWTNEEGARFPPAMLGSGVFGGEFSLEEGLGATARDGKVLIDELNRIGYSGSDPCGGRPVGYYLEPHIEQGPILEASGTSVGIVTGVQGIRWYDVSIKGVESHAGTTPMDRRSDAMLSAAQLITTIDEIAKSRPEGRSTVGVIFSTPSSRNTVAGTVDLTIDLRHPDADELSRMNDELLQAANSTNPPASVEQIWYSPPVKFDVDVVEAIRESATQGGFESADIVSGAGHDAVYINRVAPTGMLFIPCEDGLSHNEAENITQEHSTVGAEVTLQAVLRLAD